MPRRPVRLPPQRSSHVKSGILHAISLASVALSYARGRVAGERRFQAELDRAEDEIAMLREELSIKDGRWPRSRPHRRPHYDATQRMRILQLRAARGWTLETAARVFLIYGQTLLAWMSQLDDPEGRPLIQTVEPVNRYPDFVRCLVRQLKTLYPTMGSMRIAQTLAREGLRLGATTVPRIVREKSRPTSGAPAVTFVRRRRAVGRYPGHTWHLDLTAVPIRGLLGTHLSGRTPDEAFSGRPAPRQRFETRPRMPSRGIPRCHRLELVVGSLGNRDHLPVVELRPAA